MNKTVSNASALQKSSKSSTEGSSGGGGHLLKLHSNYKIALSSSKSKQKDKNASS